MPHPVCTRIALFLSGLLFLTVIQQVSASPVAPAEGQQFAPQGREVLLRRVARMTPLWRTIGSKPLGAYCQDSVECLSRLCRDGHCSFHQAMKS